MNQDCAAAACRADLVVSLAALLRPPTAVRVAEFPTEQETGELLAGAGLAAGPALHFAMNEVRESLRAAELDSWSAEYHRLFEGPMACPPNEAAFVRRDKGAILADVNGFYRAFGWRTDPHLGERPDHVVAELEFFATLLAMRASADTEDRRAVTEEALERFVFLHLGDWLPAFCEHLEGSSEAAQYRTTARALSLLWSALGAAHSWEVAVTATEGPDEEPDSPCDCPFATSNQVEEASAH